jgi:ABC-type polysaccharide/polyol phosphate export permease
VTTTLCDHAIELSENCILIAGLVQCEVRARYRGSVFGFLWSLLYPLLLLVVR